MTTNIGSTCARLELRCMHWHDCVSVIQCMFAFQHLFPYLCNRKHDGSNTSEKHDEPIKEQSRLTAHVCRRENIQHFYKKCANEAINNYYETHLPVVDDWQHQTSLCPRRVPPIAVLDCHDEHKTPFPAEQDHLDMYPEQ